MAVPPTDQCSPSGLSPSTHFPNTKVDTWHALANEVKAEVMYLSSAGKHLISGIGKPCFWHALLCYVLQFFFFWQIESLWQPCINQVCGHRFPNSICSLCLSVSRFGNFSTISQCFHYYCTCYGDLWLVTFDITITERLWLAKVQIFF